jgi:hypothetical protein
MTLTITESECDKLTEIALCNKEARKMVGDLGINIIILLGGAKHAKEKENEIIHEVLSHVDKVRKAILAMDKIQGEETTQQDFISDVMTTYTDMLNKINGSKELGHHPKDLCDLNEQINKFVGIKPDGYKNLDALLAKLGFSDNITNFQPQCYKLLNEAGITIDEELVCGFMTKKVFEDYSIGCKLVNQLHFIVDESEIGINEYISTIKFSPSHSTFYSLSWKKGKVSTQFYVMSFDSLNPENITKIIKKKTAPLEEYAKYF